MRVQPESGSITHHEKLPKWSFLITPQLVVLALVVLVLVVLVVLILVLVVVLVVVVP
jgi:hypothetical protein